MAVRRSATRRNSFKRSFLLLAASSHCDRLRRFRPDISRLQRSLHLLTLSCIRSLTTGEHLDNRHVANQLKPSAVRTYRHRRWQGTCSIDRRTEILTRALHTARTVAVVEGEE